MKQRLDKELVRRGYITTRSRAEDTIKRGFVSVNGFNTIKAGLLVDESTTIKIKPRASFVSRAGEKLYSVIDTLSLNFKNKVVLDIGSSTGGFTEVCLRADAQKVIAVDVGTDQMHVSLRKDPRVELHERTDIRDFLPNQPVDLIVIDVSFISLRDILVHVSEIATPQTEIIAMVKPQFEAGADNLKHKGVIKNDHMRRDIMKSFENWSKQLFIIEAKADSKVAGNKGNIERFYKLRKVLMR
jgi:23S rRNA (cytidine1920-2'-O)/16S rRNA (cytidine1409-2'-O)-methyltransferase